ncbi:MAG TPA: C45 family peptidase [Actinomycetota bacterium]|jgi:predicted choloylglycine hydrolase|nr:C45 family peptidase [Actinomycetota bacterium]
MAPFTFRAVEELELGPRWAGIFDERWPHYREWFLREGEAARPSYAASVRMLRAHMPELLPVYERLVHLAGGGDLAARMLSLYRPPPYLAACSQGVWTHDGGPVLARNYDYAPSRFEGLIWSTRMLHRRVIGTSDCLWGLLDGMNDSGLAVSLTFGGRRVLGDGFGIPIVVRYLLEVCESVGEARAAIARLPFSLAHNLTIVDRAGDVVTAYVSPDREPIFRAFPAATNHQGAVEWPEQAKATRTIERERCIVRLVEGEAADQNAFAEAFLHPPLYSSSHADGWGTLYTAVFRPGEGVVDYRWPSHAWRLGFERFTEGLHVENLATDHGSAAAGWVG